MKRSQDSSSQSASKRRRTSTNGIPLKHHRLQYLQPGSELLLHNPHDASIISTQISRAACIALYSAGFTSVQRNALESFEAAICEYMHHFTHLITKSMHSSRRSQPLPSDFVHALSAFNLTSSSLLPILTLFKSIPPSVTLPPLFSSSASTTSTNDSFTTLPTLPSSTQTPRRSYIPQHFPPFPSAHAYLSTPIYTPRLIDARLIRERATAEGMEAEKALRKLVKASKVGSQRLLGSGSEEGIKKMDQVFRETLVAVAAEGGGDENGAGIGMFVFDGAGDEKGEEKEDEDAMGIMVNYEREFWRRASNYGGKARVV